MINEYQLVQVAIGGVKGYISPTESERAAAYELLVELSTRTSGAHLASTDDSIRDALGDLQAMFGLTRRILRKHGADASKGSPGNLSLAVVAVRVLNEVIRPVLSRWQPVLSDYEAKRPVGLSEVEWEQRWDRGPLCRAELREMRSSIRSYIDTLSRIAGAPDISDAVLRVPTSTMFPKQPMRQGFVKEEHPAPRTRMVRWLDIPEMVRTGRSKRPADASLTKMDEQKREREAKGEPAAVEEPVFAEQAVEGEEFWFDYVADMGDGFDGTAPVAWLIGRNHLEVPDDQFGEFPTPPYSMPHAKLLVFGGDQVYPFAKAGCYEAQTELPYTMALEGDVDNEPTLLAIPGNHDWLGGLEHFEAMFVRNEEFGRKEKFAGHWNTVQAHPWWHAKLPQGWWLWGIDTGLENELVGDQAAYFAAAAQQLGRGDRVILCSPVPLWQLRQKYRDAYATLRNTIDPLIADQEATMPLCLSGDSHYFAHYERLDTQSGEDHITAGGGGAFLQPTHNLAERIPLEDGNAEFKLTNRWPQPADSRSLAPGVSNFFSRQYWPLMVIAGLLQLAFAGLVALGPQDSGSDETMSWSSALSATLQSPFAMGFLVLLTLAGIPAIKGNSSESKLTSGTRVYGLLTGGAVSMTLILVEIIRQRIFDGDWYGYALAAVAGGALTIAAFFFMVTWTNSRIKAADTLAFSPAHSTRFKHFLRFRIDRDGDLTCFAVGIDPVGEGWYDAMVAGDPVPPHDRDGIPNLHYIWGKTFRKFRPTTLNIALSISATGDEDRTDPGETFVDACEKLIRRGHTLVYGGWQDAGYTADLQRIEEAQHEDNPNAGRHLLNYVPEYLWDPEAAETSLTKAMPVRRGGDVAEPQALRENRDLTAMRRHVTRCSDARITIGGNCTPAEPGVRTAPGVLEEAYLAVEAGVPLIVAGGFGGVGKLLADAMLGQSDPAELDELAAHFVPPDRQPDGSKGLGFRDMLARFNTIGVLRNGLTDGENAELLRSSDTNSVSELILRSVHRIGVHRAH